jgi:hypothetical protein
LLSGVRGDGDVGNQHGGGGAKTTQRMTRPRTAGHELLDGGRSKAGQERHLLGDGIGRVRLLGQSTSSAQKARHTVVDLLQDLGDLLVGGRG